MNSRSQLMSMLWVCSRYVICHIFKKKNCPLRVQWSHYETTHRCVIFFIKIKSKTVTVTQGPSRSVWTRTDHTSTGTMELKPYKSWHNDKRLMACKFRNITLAPPTGKSSRLGWWGWGGGGHCGLSWWEARLLGVHPVPMWTLVLWFGLLPHWP